MIEGFLEMLRARKPGLRTSKATRSAAPSAAPAAEFSHEVFLAPDALAINEARLCHLASLGLDLAGKRVLEVGGGIGLHTCFFESLGCTVTFTDARPENVREAKRRYPQRTTAVLDLDQEPDLGRLGMFDIIYCYGTLYHLSKPKEALRALAQVCREMILLETCVTPGEEESLNPLPEQALNPNQAVSGIGCRPARPWVMRQLRDHFGWAYHSVTQPLHPDFERNWLEPAPRKLYRAVFVGSKQPLMLPSLSECIRYLQNTVPDDTRGVWLDVGAHLGETTFESAAQHPDLTVYAFEPNLKLAGQRFDLLSNYIVVPMAVSEQNGFGGFHANTHPAALKPKAEVTVPRTRLDSFLATLGISRVDFLEIDTQGVDLSVVRSAGAQLAHIRKIKLEVAVTPTPLHPEAASKEEVVRYLAGEGFALVGEQPQTHRQEEILVFFKVGADLRDVSPLDLSLLPAVPRGFEKPVRSLSEECLLALACSVAELRPLRPYPGWTFSSAETSKAPEIQLRHAIWQSCWERKLEKPILFPWHDGLQINLYLGNDMSRPTFIGGCIEPNEFVFMGSVLTPGMVMLDVGANDGFFTVFAARRVADTGLVYAFEPSEREFARLKANVALNRLSNVRPVKKAVAESWGKGVLHVCGYGHEGQNTLGDFVHKVQGVSTEPVELCSLDTYFSSEKLTRLDLIKIDVEGAEQRVLSGARGLISRFKPIILLELLDPALRKQGSSAEAVIGLLKEMGYLIYDFSPETGRLIRSELITHSENIVASSQPL